MHSTVAIIKTIVAKLKRRPELANDLSDNADLIKEVGLDSLELLQFMLEVEEQLGIQINFDALEFSYLSAIQELAAFLERMPRRQPVTGPV